MFGPNLLFLADWLARGSFTRAVRELACYAAVGRVSLWELAYKNVVLPLVPGALRKRLVVDDRPAQPWLAAETLHRYRIAARALFESDFNGAYGDKYRHAVLTRMNNLTLVTSAGTLPDLLDVRYPLMYRPLVEFAMRLPPGLRGRPHAQRWVLRAAMKGILPDRVRTRVGKQEYGRGRRTAAEPSAAATCVLAGGPAAQRARHRAAERTSSVARRACGNYGTGSATARAGNHCT